MAQTSDRPRVQPSNGRVPLEAVNVTAELGRRGSRPADHESENRALASLMEEMTRPDGNVLQKLAETALGLCGAHSAGISTLEEEGGRKVFRWRAVAGRWAPFLGGTMPREMSPCGTVLDRDSVLLLSRPHRHYPIPVEITPPIAEVLLAPFHVAGEPVGTIWAIAHDDSRQFQQEDERLLKSLGRFAATAHEVLAANRQKAPVVDQLMTELAAARQLQQISTQMIQEGDSDALYHQILDAAVAIMRSDMASMQIVDESRDALRMLAWRGFDPGFGRIFALNRPDTKTSCSVARRAGQRVIVPDVDTCDFLVGTSALEDHRQTGIRAVQSTPLVSRRGRVLGMISTHWRTPHEPAERDLRLLDILARQAADLIERAQAEQALRDSERRFREMIDALPAAIYTTDAAGRLTHFNPAAVEFSGRVPELGTDQWCVSFKLFRADGTPLPHDECPMAVALKEGRVVRGAEAIAERPDGTRLWFQPYPTPLLDTDGRVIGGINMLVDITDRKRAEAVLRDSEQRLRQSEAQYRLLFDSNPHPMWVFDRQTLGFLAVNEAAVRQYGYSRDEFLAMTLRDIRPADEVPEMVRYFERVGRHVPAGQIDHAGIWQHRRKDGSLLEVEVTGSPICFSGHDASLVLAVDVTQRQRAEEALKEADRRKDEFLATLAHELRNPLAPICNAVELMRRASGDGAVVEDARSVLERQLQHVVRLIDDLLDISRISRGKLQLRKEPVELAAVLHSAVESSRPLIDASRHELTLMLPQGVYVDADPIRLSQVFANLLNNAAKYTERGGHLWLNAQQKEAEVVVSVRDTGIGIAPEHLPRLFQMFSQLTPALERPQGGLGIGLSLVRGLVELHGGRIEARSDGPGLGSEFVVSLPLLREPETHAPRDATTKPDHTAAPSRPCVLVVDDNRDAANSLAMMLRVMGHEAHTAYNGLEALQAAATFRPDVVLLDIGLPKMNGYEVARHLRRQPGGNKMMLIALTGWGQEEDRRRAMEAGFDHHLTKPLDVPALEKLLTSAVV